MPFSAHSLGMKSRFVNLESSDDDRDDCMIMVEVMNDGGDNDGSDNIDGTLMMAAMMVTVMMMTVMMMKTVMTVTPLSC